jgi:hypothetical protein
LTPRRLPRCHCGTLSDAAAARGGIPAGRDTLRQPLRLHVVRDRLAEERRNHAARPREGPLEQGRLQHGLPRWPV